MPCASSRCILRESAPTSLAMRWLIPRLDCYHADHPHVEVMATTVSCVMEDLRGGVDVSIRRRVAREDLWPQHRVVPVLEDVDTLIMSPTLFARRRLGELARRGRAPTPCRTSGVRGRVMSRSSRVTPMPEIWLPASSTGLSERRVAPSADFSRGMGSVRNFGCGGRVAHDQAMAWVKRSPKRRRTGPGPCPPHGQAWSIGALVPA